MDQTYPRSPKETMAGLAHIPRMIDKARAWKNNALGEYIFPCPLDEVILDFLGVKAEEFAEVAATHEDPGVARWAGEKCSERGDTEKRAINHRILEHKPETEEQSKTFLEALNKLDPSRTDIQTWVDLIDLEEGRL